MKFKAKLFKLGNSRAIYVPKSIYKDLKEEEHEWEVYTKETNNKPVYTVMPKDVYTKPKGKLVFNVSTGQNEWK